MAKRDYAAEWDPRQRYRIIKVKEGEQQEVCSTDSTGGIGLALVTCHSEGEWDDGEAVGVLDTAKWEKNKPGEWIINPYARGVK